MIAPTTAPIKPAPSPAIAATETMPRPVQPAAGDTDHAEVRAEMRHQIIQCVDADLDLAVAITEGIPVRDMIRAKQAMAGSKTRLIGTNCHGIVTPGTGKRQHFLRRAAVLRVAVGRELRRRAQIQSPSAPVPRRVDGS